MRDQKLANLKSAFERFLADGDTAAFVETVRFNRCRPPANASYPAHHRLCDFVHDTVGYRVTRLVTGDSELIFIQPCDVAHPSMGVPYHLQGVLLRRWMQDEVDLISREQHAVDTDWGHYLNPTGDPQDRR